MSPLLRLSAALLSGVCLAAPAAVRQPVDYVNPHIGGIGHLLRATAPVVQLPHGMARMTPVAPQRVRDRYLADRIQGFPAGGALLMATTSAESASGFDHDFETVTPYYYAVDLEDSGIHVEATTTAQAFYYRFAFPAAARARLRLTAHNQAELKLEEPSAIAGCQTSPRERTCIWAEFSQSLGSWAPWTSDGIGFESAGPTAQGQRVEVRIGVSHISVEQARRNLRREIPAWNFNAVKQNARGVWNEMLSRIAIRGGTAKQKTIFYTALYRTLCRMTDITEDGCYYSGFDHQVHDAEGHPFYVDDGLWDTYRSAHPLQLLIDAPRQVDMVRSYIRMYQQSGWLPSFPGVNGERALMIGHHAAALIADTWAKGHHDFDAETAYRGMRRNALEATVLPWRRGPLTALDQVYQQQGFFPALAKGEAETVKDVHPFERRQAVAVTLENCYDDWCVSQMARALHKQEDYELFRRRALNYRKLYDARTGFMAPRSADGRWVEGFDPLLGGGQGGRDWYAECNAWVYTWHVQHDPAGLIQLMGGRESFIARLDQLFVEPQGVSKFVFQNQFPDMTGLIGKYPQGNEPAFHIPYLYNYAGQPWKTQRRLRQIMDIWYGDGPLGICGDEDGGAMSSWYVFAAMGFYPVAPGRADYNLGSPLFAETRIRVAPGRVFTILAEGTSAQNKYIQSARWNGKPLPGPWFPHEAIAQGGTLQLKMGPRPNRNWAGAPNAAPPSLSQE